MEPRGQISLGTVIEGRISNYIKATLGVTTTCGRLRHCR